MSVIPVRHVSKAQARSISIYPFDKQELYKKKNNKKIKIKIKGDQCYRQAISLEASPARSCDSPLSHS